MWVLPKNYQLSSVFAADMVESKEDLSLQGLNIEQSLMWKSKPSPLKTWCKRWKEDSFLPHLFTRILKPSQRKSFETKLTSSLEDIHVRHFHKQEKDKEKTTPDTYGLSLENTWKQLDLVELCSKTSKVTYRLDSAQSLATWKKMVLIQRGEYSVRVKLAHTTREKEYLSWATPNTLDHLPPRSSEGVTKQATTTRKGRKRPSNLREQVDQKTVDIYKYQSWPTVMASDWKNMDTCNQMQLAKAVKVNWPTATVFDATGGGYPTEIVNGQYKSKHSKDPDSPWYGAKLADAVKVNWPTPATRDYKGGQNVETCKGKNRNPMTNSLPDAVRATTDSKALNPDWVEKLMGVPTGWTALDGNSNEWQNNWSGDWEGNTPRTTDVKKDRVDRIRMLGNGVVPATAAKAWTVLSARLNKGD